MMKEITFKCIIEDGQNEEISFDVTEDDDLTLKEFKTWVRAKYQIPGLVSLYISDHELTDLRSTLGKVLLPSEPLVIRSDKTVVVAAGSYVEGGRATGGGSGVGGMAHAGKGIGGDAEGDSGAAGEGLGGTASTPDGEAVSGRGTGVQFQRIGGAYIASTTPSDFPTGP